MAVEGDDQARRNAVSTRSRSANRSGMAVSLAASRVSPQRQMSANGAELHDVSPCGPIELATSTPNARRGR